MRLQIDTFEDNATSPVISHTFYGRTDAEVQGVVQAHMQTDSFFRAAMTSGKFQGMTLTNKMRWSK